MCELERFYLKLRDAKEKFDFTVHRQAEAGFNLLVCDRLMHIFTKKKNILLKTLLLFVYLTTLPLHCVLYRGYM